MTTANTPSALHLTPANAPRLSVAGDIYTLLITGEHTGGEFMLVDAVVFPGGGPPPHTHEREDETFYVIEGTVTFTAAGRTFDAGPGESVYIPRGVPHTFHNHTDRPARMLFQCRPAGIEKMFLEIGVPMAPGETAAHPVTPEMIEKILTICPRYGVTIHAPGA